MQVNVKYRSWNCQDSQKLQNNASSHYPTNIFALRIYFSQNVTPLFRIHVFRTRKPIRTPSLPWLQNLNFKFGTLRREKKRGLAFYTRTSCLRSIQTGLTSSNTIYSTRFDECCKRKFSQSNLSKIDHHPTRSSNGPNMLRPTMKDGVGPTCWIRLIYHTHSTRCSNGSNIIIIFY